MTSTPHTCLQAERTQNDLRMIYTFFALNGQYGIEAILYQNGQETDRRRVDQITADRERGLRIFLLLYEYFVTPCTLLEVLEDLLCDM